MATPNALNGPGTFAAVGYVGVEPLDVRCLSGSLHEDLSRPIAIRYAGCIQPHSQEKAECVNYDAELSAFDSLHRSDGLRMASDSPLPLLA